MKKIIALLAVSIALLLSGQASAALIINGDFTADNWPANTAFPAQPTNLSSISGWTFLPGATIVGLGAGFAGIPTPSVDLTGWADDVPGSGIRQNLGTSAGNSYTIGFTIYDFGAAISRVDFKLNNTLLGNSLTGQGSSHTYSYNFTSIGNDEVSFSWPGAIPTNVAVLANVTVSPAVAPVPEPGQVAASLVLLAGIGGYVAMKRRRAMKTAA